MITQDDAKNTADITTISGNGRSTEHVAFWDTASHAAFSVVSAYNIVGLTVIKTAHILNTADIV